jgi:hypothetical protein
MASNLVFGGRKCSEITVFLSAFWPLFVILSSKSKAMAKSKDARKETKKKPVKTLKEKRAEKREKKNSKN